MASLNALSSALLRTSRRAFHAVKAVVGSCDNVVKVTWSDGVETQHNATWLRHNCACPDCVQRHSGQRLLMSQDLKIVNKVTPLAIEDTCLRAACDGHVSMTPLHCLRTAPLATPTNDATTPPPSADAANNASATAAAGRKKRVHEYSDVLADENALFAWLNDLGQTGYAVISGAAGNTDAVVNLANTISHPQPTIYGTTFDVVATDAPINIAYSTAQLELHQDIVYYESPPGLQFLHALQFDDTVAGGESVLMDAFAVASRFRDLHPAHFDVLTRVPMRFQKVHYERELPVHIASLKPIIRLDHNGEIVEVTWSPPFEGPLPNTLPVDQVSAFYEAYVAFAQCIHAWDDLHVERRLHTGDVLTFNNRRMLHGRRAFDLRTHGHRHLKGVYVNINEFASRLNFLCIKRNVAPPAFYGDGQMNVI
ncbi:hypothetical protein PTSG_07142 [Salpingoeca rosetta]|uniref:Gamma-butyrobetaine dioxygenase n=1 Tax=Salpingoeca rosetta (strain ATCC 50818 / BSB-021) TaxID=946362 RepID=F2UE64_SALR5|nr:uncharacterized protein PTSG_07142 [Salpingoeca rosetta]EGD74914.1 hypothetical protein PTSG_07142 [Salpingoeca rosetta]|eukprot:XP_004992559.1 hypothetical protein PTSG_07142 [Salpingoeca rosetta]